MTNTKLATFRIDEKVWEQFITKAKKAGDTASGVLIRTIHTYLEGQEIAQTESQPGIYLAIAPDHQITYIDRAVRSNQWIPPYQLRHSDSRFEWIQSSDPTLLSAIEDVLIQAFDPPLNFRPKTQSAHPEPPTPIDQDPNPIPSDIAAKIQELLVRGMPSTDILNALDSLSLPQPPIEVKPEPQPDPSPQVDNAIIKHLEALTQSITTLTQEVKVKVNQRIDAVETQVKQRPTVIQTSPKPENKDQEIPKLSKGTASLDQLPKQPESTRGLAKRWKITQKTLTRQRQRYETRPDGFFHYSLAKEQGQFGWLYDGEQQLFYAVTELPTSIQQSVASVPDSTTSTINSTQDASTSNSNATKAKDLPKPLSAEQLGHRFRNPNTQRPISGRGIEMALRRHPIPDDFAHYCRQRDPNGYGWQFDEHQKLFLCLGKP